MPGGACGRAGRRRCPADDMLRQRCRTRTSNCSACRNLQSVQEVTAKNALQLKMARGDDPVVGRDPSRRAVATQAMKEIIDQEITATGRHYVRQFRCLVAGAVLFIGWHVLQIYLRSTH